MATAFRAVPTAHYERARSHSIGLREADSTDTVPIDQVLGGEGISGAALSDLVQAEIIPRLLVAHSSDASFDVRSGSQAVDPAEAEAFAPLPLELEADELLAEVDALLTRGVSVESVFVDLLAPSARKLGELWEQDACDFVDVTMGLWRLQEVMREVAVRSPAFVRFAGASPSALFSPMPGEQHSFGALMIEEVFERAGWQGEVLIEPRRKDLLHAVAERAFDLVGLTISCDCPSDALAELVTAIRGVSKNPITQVFIGGRMVNANPEMVAEAGADGTAPDAKSALALAQSRMMGSRSITRVVP